MSADRPRPHSYSRTDLDRLQEELLTDKEIPTLIQCPCFRMVNTDAGSPNTV